MPAQLVTTADVLVFNMHVDGATPYRLMKAGVLRLSMLHQLLNLFLMAVQVSKAEFQKTDRKYERKEREFL